MTANDGNSIAPSFVFSRGTVGNAFVFDCLTRAKHACAVINAAQWWGCECCRMSMIGPV